jgi:hypothetical protein
MNLMKKSGPNKVQKTTVEPDFSQLPFHVDTIKCPKCSEIQSAQVVHAWPKYKYRHKCVACGLGITKTNWNSVE